MLFHLATENFSDKKKGIKRSFFAGKNFQIWYLKQGI